jgi:hypothetical protein
MAKRRKKEEELSREDFDREEQVEELGEFRHKSKTGKHILGENPNMKIKGKRFKRISESGDILVCPPSIIAPFMDRFERIDVLPTIAPSAKKKLTREHKGGGRYNVINANGVKINNDFLTKDEANELIVSDGADVEDDD